MSKQEQTSLMEIGWITNFPEPGIMILFLENCFEKVKNSQQKKLAGYKKINAISNQIEIIVNNAGVNQVSLFQMKQIRYLLISRILLFHFPPYV